jgi:hypothetical protein
MPYTFGKKAYYCVALARKCTDVTTARCLQALGIELIEKAAETERQKSLIDSPPRKKP